MKKTLIIASCALAAFMFVGCDSKAKLKPIIVGSYKVVNNTIGTIRQTPAVITNNIDTFITAAKVTKSALEFLATKIGPEKMKPYIDAVSSAIVVLEAIKADPSQVTSKIDQLISGLEKARDGIVEVAKWAGCESDLPDPKANVTATPEQIATDSVELQKLIDSNK